MTMMTTGMLRRAARLYVDGMLPRAISAELGVSPCTVRHHLRAVGVLQPRDRRVLAHLPQACVRDAVRLYASGAGIRAVAKRAMVSYNTARKLLIREGVALRSQKTTRHAPNASREA